MIQEKKKGNRQNYVSRIKSTKASPSVAPANVVINVDNARQKLQELKSVYQQKEDFADTRGFLTDLRTALGIPNDRGACKYGVVKGGDFIASISLTNHNSNAQTYVDANANYPYNLRLMIRRRYRKNTFKPHPSVNLEEYVYFGQEMVKCTNGNPYLLIIDGIIEFLSSGKYEDKTGIARKNQSPSITESKTNKNMKKNTVKINENTLRQIVAESVKKVLNEEMSDGVIDEGLEEMERILSSIVDTLNLNEYAPNGINGLDKERAISGIKSIKNGISTLYQATSNISSEY